METNATVRELDCVVLLHDMPAERLQRGDIGTVVLVHGDGVAFEVEFVAEAGQTVAVVTLSRDEVRLLKPAEATLTRVLAV